MLVLGAFSCSSWQQLEILSWLFALAFYALLFQMLALLEIERQCLRQHEILFQFSGDTWSFFLNIGVPLSSLYLKAIFGYFLLSSSPAFSESNLIIRHLTFPSLSSITHTLCHPNCSCQQCASGTVGWGFGCDRNVVQWRAPHRE